MVELQRCVTCGNIKIPHKRVENGVVCQKCYRPSKQVCSVCGISGTVAKRIDNKPICHRCYDPPKEICSQCGVLSAVNSRENDVILCKKCYRCPKHICLECGDLAPSAKKIESGYLCNNCYHKNTKSVCSLCGKLRRVSTSSNGMIICPVCRIKQRYTIDEEFHLVHKLRARFSSAMKTYSRNGKVKTSSQYGIDYVKIIQHLGSCPGRRTEFHIDHIFPLAAFDFNDLQQIKAAFAPENHRWLTKQANLSKNDAYDEQAFQQYLKEHGCGGCQ